ncbi:MAG: hypothetical protein WC071_05025 [Victivallaceae bacterium]
MSRSKIFTTIRRCIPVVCLCCLAPLRSLGDEAVDVNSEAKKLASQVKQQKAELFKEIDTQINQAKSLAAKREYPEAMGIFMKVQSKLSAIDGDFARFKLKSFEHDFNEFKAKWSNDILMKARKLGVEKKYEEAINTVSEATLIDPRKSDEVTYFINYCKKMQKGMEFENNTKLTNIDKNYTQNIADIDLLYREAQVLYKNQRYVEVRSKLEKIFIKDPFNQKAIELLDKTYNKIYAAAQQRKVADWEGMFAYENWTWNEPVLPTHMDRAIKKSAVEKKADSYNIYRKMENIIFPSVEFDDADIFSVIRYLNRNSKRYDPDQEGVSIISGFTKETADKLPKVTMSFAKIPMSEVLRYLTQGVGLKYKIDENAVVIGTNVDEMQTQYFTIRGDLISSITNISDEAGGGAATTGIKTKFKKDDKIDTATTFDTDATASTDKPALSLTSAALIKYFEDRGVTFAEGASIAYDRRAGKLIVKNTLENLRKLDDLLRQIDMIKTPLVLVEAKIVELIDNDVEELGFDWYFSVPYSSSQPGSDHPTWSINQDGNDNPLRHYQSINTPNATGTSDYNVVNNLKLLPNFGKSLFGDGTTVDLSLSINAISQNTRAEVLSSPKIITTSGTEATIKMVEETYFPTSWSDPTITVSGSAVTVEVPIPEFGDATDIGILFSVKPVVNPDNYTVTLHVMPQVVSFVQFSKYPVYITATQTVTSADPDVAPVTSTIVNSSFDIQMPEIARRDVDANIKVYDGETIVLGGMVDNKNVFRDDAWPVLGDIPLLGRLFRSQLAFTQKSNLLIFITTRLINNDGIPVRRNRQRGIPEFYR